ncbi:hypothetical protein ABW21_db0206282 [Orbilia brochopaga]|nr:hypothetical protein ABW21_db0206282 [Drechslerella brochopaga]
MSLISEIPRLGPVIQRFESKQDPPYVDWPLKIGSRHLYYADKSDLELIDEKGIPRKVTGPELRSLYKSFRSVHSIRDDKDGIVFFIGKKPLVDKFPLSIGGRPLYVSDASVTYWGSPFEVQSLFPLAMMPYRKDIVLFENAWHQISSTNGLPDELVQVIFRMFPTCTSVMRLRRELYLEFANFAKRKRKLPDPYDTPITIAGLITLYSPRSLWTDTDEDADIDLVAPVPQSRTITSDAEDSIQDNTYYNNYRPRLFPGVQVTNYKGVASNSGLVLRNVNTDGKERFTVALHCFLEAGVLVDDRVFYQNPQGQLIGNIRETYPSLDIGLVEPVEEFTYENGKWYDTPSPEFLGSRDDIDGLEERFFSHATLDSSVIGHQELAVVGHVYHNPIRPSGGTNTDLETGEDGKIGYERYTVWRTSMVDTATRERASVCGVPIIQKSYLDPEEGTVNKSICTGLVRYAKGPLFCSQALYDLVDDGWAPC